MLQHLSVYEAAHIPKCFYDSNEAETSCLLIGDRKQRGGCLPGLTSVQHMVNKSFFGLNEDVVRFEWWGKGWVGAGQG